MSGGLLAIASPVPAPAAEAARVLMVDNEPDLTNWHFEPAEVTVPAGATVVWFNKGNEDHTVTADDKSFDSGIKKPGTSWERMFTKAGQYSYYCAPHPWMKGTVRVVAARSAAAEAPATATSLTTVAPPTSTPPSTAAPVPAATASTFPPSLGVQGSDTPAEPEATPPSPPPPAPGEFEDAVAAPAGHRGGSENVLGTTAVVVLPTLGALAIGARLRRRSEAAEV